MSGNHLSIQKPGYTMGGAGRGGARRPAGRRGSGVRWRGAGQGAKDVAAGGCAKVTSDHLASKGAKNNCSRGLPGSTNILNLMYIELIESKTRTYHGRVGTGRRTAGWRGGDGQHRTPTGRPAQETTVPRIPPRQPKTVLLGVSLEARTSEIPFKPMGEQKQRLTRGLCAVYPRDGGRSSFLVADQCAADYLSL